MELLKQVKVKFAGGKVEEKTVVKTKMVVDSAADEFEIQRRDLTAMGEATRKNEIKTFVMWEKCNEEEEKEYLASKDVKEVPVKAEVVEPEEKSEPSDLSLDNAREMYEKVFGKKPHHMKKVDALVKEIEEELAKK